MRELLTVEQYQADLAALVGADVRTEDVPLTAAGGRVLAVPAHASTSAAASGAEARIFDNFSCTSASSLACF